MSSSTSSLCSHPRQAAVYEICQEYDIIILEDDPYFYLQFGGEGPVRLLLFCSSLLHPLQSFSSSSADHLGHQCHQFIT